MKNDDTPIVIIRHPLNLFGNKIPLIRRGTSNESSVQTSLGGED